MFDFLPKEIDFLDEYQIEPLRDKMEDELLHIMNDKSYTIEALEEMLLVAQSWVMPVTQKILNYNSMSRFSELKKAFEYVSECWKKHEKKPYSKIEYYVDMCYDMGPIVGEDDEEASLTQEEVEALREEYFAEREEKEPEEGIITICDYQILEKYYYFLDYFSGNGCSDRDWLIRHCIWQINNTLFNILWYVDYVYNPRGQTKASSFRKAVKEICDMDSKFRLKKI